MKHVGYLVEDVM